MPDRIEPASVDASNPLPSPPTLNAVAAIGPRDVWAVGSYGEDENSSTLIEHWDGQRWAAVPGDVLDTGVSPALSAISALSPSDIWTGGVSVVDPQNQNPHNYPTGEVLIGHWTRSSWSLRDGQSASSGYPSVEGIAARTPADVWAVGTFNDQGNDTTMIQHWDGTAWSLMRADEPAHAADSFLGGVAVINPRDAWAVGGTGGASDRPLVEHWDGAAWHRTPIPPRPGHLLAVTAVGPHDVWADGLSNNGALVAHWDGKIWRYVAVPPALSGAQLAAVTAAGGAVWFGGFVEARGSTSPRGAVIARITQSCGK